MFPRHARLQNMTYSARMKIYVNFKTGIDKVVQKNVVHTENREIIMGRMPVMQTCMNRLWISNSQGWTVSYNFEVKRNKLIVRLVELTKLEYIRGEKKGLRGYFLSIEIPIWILFLPLCISVPRLNSRRHKVRFLGYMVKCLLEAYTGHRKCDNRDSFRNKRFKLASELLERELKVHVSHALKCMTKALQRDLYGDRDSTGAWCHPFKWMERVYGVMGNLGRANPLQTMIDLRKTRQQVLYTGKVGDARYPTNISESLVDELFDSGMEKQVDDTYTKLDGKHKVFLNGEWVGVEIKRDEQQREVHIFSDAGRILRLLIVVENMDKIKAFKEGNYIFTSLLDKFLLGDIAGRQSMKYTHCELDMSFLLGLSCGIIPFANHDHARRVLYQAQKHSQQAIGFSTTNPNIRVDTLFHQLHYPQRPLFRTMISDCLVLPKPELFNGQNAIVAVNVHLGYNQEDSLVMKRASLERGMFRSEHIRSYKAEVDNKELTDKRRKSEDSITFGKIQSKIGRVDNLDDDGFPFIGANMQSGDIVIGKCAESGTDHSVKLKHTERGIVQKVVLSSNDGGKNSAVGSQACMGKRVFWAFWSLRRTSFFTIQGVAPDIVINPHAFPSRPTTGYGVFWGALVQNEKFRSINTPLFLISSNGEGEREGDCGIFLLN
ncbi:DNA-directed RNA polymerase family protein [Salix suchowensis]|nr:DNA-directed RNA polymerase family protein [Salix suchowensis]